MSRNLPRRFGNYELTRLIARGGMAEVYEGYRDGLFGARSRVAVKCILPHLTEDETFVRMFIDEARNSVHLHHPNIVQVQEFNQVDGIYFIAMEYVEGWTVAGLLERLNKLKMSLPFRLVVEIMIQALTGLSAAHDGVDAEGQPMDLVHRDIKPANLFITRQGVVKIGDFGVARAGTALFHTLAPNQVKGTLGYMSPEQLRAQPLTRTTDLFSMGLILYELLTGERLFQQDSLLSAVQHVNEIRSQDVARSLPESCAMFGPVLVRALERDPHNRYQHADDFIAELRELSVQLPSAPILKQFLQPLWSMPIPAKVEPTAELESALLELVSESEDRPRGGTVQMGAERPPERLPERLPERMAKPASTPDIPGTLHMELDSPQVGRPPSPLPSANSAAVKAGSAKAESGASAAKQASPAASSKPAPSKSTKSAPAIPATIVDDAWSHEAEDSAASARPISAPHKSKVPEPAPVTTPPSTSAPASTPATSAEVAVSPVVKPRAARSILPLVVGGLFLMMGGAGATWWFLQGKQDTSSDADTKRGSEKTLVSSAVPAPASTPAPTPASASTPAPALASASTPAPALASASTPAPASKPASLTTPVPVVKPVEKETSSPVSARPEPPKAVTSRTEAPRTVAPKTEAPKMVVTRVEPPKTVAAKTEASKGESSKAVASKTEKPKAGNPAPTASAGTSASPVTPPSGAGGKVKVRISAIPFDDTYIRIDGGGRQKVPWSGELSPGKHVIVAICEGISDPYELRTELNIAADKDEIKAAWRCQEKSWYLP